MSNDSLPVRRFLKCARPLRGHRLLRWMTFVAAVGCCSSSILAADKPPEVEAAIRKAAGFLNTTQTIKAEERGLVAYTLLSAGESPESPQVKAQVDEILKKFASGYKPTAQHAYEAGVDAMGLVAADREKYKGHIQLIAEHMVREQRNNGAWDYPMADFQGDTSITQYGMLGLWAAHRAGVQIPSRVWDETAQWHLRTQLKDGAFGYHPLSGEATPKHSMTVAGVGSLAIAKLMLSKSPQSEPDSSPKETESKPKKSDKAFGVLERVNPQEATDQPGTVAAPAMDANFKQKTGRRQMEDGIGRGMAWLSRNYTVDNPTGWHMYYFYGLERVASLTNSDKIGGRDWYKDGCANMIKKQAADGSFNDAGGLVTSTCFATLFMTRATEKLVPNTPPPPPKSKAPTFGGGILAGGRGLPTDMANVDTKDGNITAKKQPDTPLDKLLAELENPKSQKVESAQAALVEAVQVGKREQLVGQKDLLLKLAKDSRVDVRRTAFWALARCNDLRVAPVLIEGLMDADFDAAVEARNALCVLSRRPRGFGLPDDLIAKLPEGASQAEKDSAFERWRDEDLRRWRDWYQSVRPYSERDKLPD